MQTIAHISPNIFPLGCPSRSTKGRLHSRIHTEVSLDGLPTGAFGSPGNAQELLLETDDYEKAGIPPRIPNRLRQEASFKQLPWDTPGWGNAQPRLRYT
jgi:hypothetical protein